MIVGPGLPAQERHDFRVGLRRRTRRHFLTAKVVPGSLGDHLANGAHGCHRLAAILCGRQIVEHEFRRRHRIGRVDPHASLAFGTHQAQEVLKAVLQGDTAMLQLAK